RVRRMSFELAELPFEQYVAKLEERHGIVEERIDGAEVRSPSVQLRVVPDGTVELLSTHDQLLGGPSGQSYLGCRFPADHSYARRTRRTGGPSGSCSRRPRRPSPSRTFRSTERETRRVSRYGRALPADVAHLDLRQVDRLRGAQLGIAVAAHRPESAQRFGDV